MTITYQSPPAKDWIGLRVYYRDAKGNLCQYSAASEIMDLEAAVADCQEQVLKELTSYSHHYKNMAILAVIKGGKA